MGTIFGDIGEGLGQLGEGVVSGRREWGGPGQAVLRMRRVLPDCDFVRTPDLQRLKDRASAAKVRFGGLRRGIAVAV